MKKAGIIGLGAIYPMHKCSLQELGIPIGAVCDKNEDLAKKTAAELNCAYYTDYKEMIKTADIEVVHVCTPHYLHAPMSIYAAKKGKHVLTEKPMSIHLHDALEMIEAAKANKVTLGVIYQNRYNPGSILLKSNLESGALGKIISGKFIVTWHRSNEYYKESEWRGTIALEGGGVLINQAIHTLELTHWFVNSKLDYVSANCCNRLHDTINVEDMAEGIIVYKNGIHVNFYATTYYSCDAPIEIELHCENGTARLIGSKGIINFKDGSVLEEDTDPNEFIDYGNGIKAYWGVSHYKQVKNFYESIEKGVAPDITGAEALNVQRLLCAIYDSGRNNHRVYF